MNQERHLYERRCTASPASPRRRRSSSRLSDGDWVLVRAELTYGQERRLA